MFYGSQVATLPPVEEWTDGLLMTKISGVKRAIAKRQAEGRDVAWYAQELETYEAEKARRRMLHQEGLIKKAIGGGLALILVGGILWRFSR